MKDYVRQMSYLDMLEKDVAFLQNFLPKTLEVDIEHRGFLQHSIRLQKGWEEEGGTSNSLKKQETRQEDLAPTPVQRSTTEREHGLAEGRSSKVTGS
ncbi:MAG: hypothetical protein Q9N34_02060 [Aquificota bacterium]|nr:hypothetical protein [Aquificota bacterium]